jgi:hypothetical protein
VRPFLLEGVALDRERVDRRAVGATWATRNPRGYVIALTKYLPSGDTPTPTGSPKSL